MTLTNLCWFKFWDFVFSPILSVTFFHAYRFIALCIGDITLIRNVASLNLCLAVVLTGFIAAYT